MRSIADNFCSAAGALVVLATNLTAAFGSGAAFTVLLVDATGISGNDDDVKGVLVVGCVDRFG